LDKGVPGINIKKGLLRFNGDKDAYLDVLRSYAKNTPPLLETAGEFNEDDLTDYTTTVHGIKGSSGGVCAEEVAGMAEALEKAAQAGDYDYIVTHNDSLIQTTRKLISDILNMTAEIDASNLKPKKTAPDIKTLERLRQACADYEMSDVDTALEELEAFDYESGGDLVIWLQENVELMNFDEIIEKL